MISRVEQMTEAEGLTRLAAGIVGGRYIMDRMASSLLGTSFDSQTLRFEA